MITSITLKNKSNFSRINEPVQIAIPLPISKFMDPFSVILRTENEDDPLMATQQITGRWPDNSIKWIVLETVVTLLPFEEKILHVLQSKIKSDLLSINPLFTFANQPNSEFFGLLNGKQKIALSVKDTQHNPLDLSSLSQSTLLSNTVKSISEIEYKINNPTNEHLSLLCRVHDYHRVGKVKFEIIIKNRNAAVHPGEFWDLGDAGSFYFRELSLIISTENSSTSIEPFSDKPNDSFFSKEKKGIIQQSSGGTNWKSENHITGEGTSFREIPGAYAYENNRETPFSRVTPAFYFREESKKCLYGMSMCEFWENFPSAITAQGTTASFSLFPDSHNERYELQGGEQKKQTLWFQIFDNTDTASMKWIHEPIETIISPEWYEQCGVYSLLSTANDQTTREIYNTYLNRCIAGDDSFINRREIIDEYGWRNFGELYADHESSYLENGKYNISHYNNQYDFAFYAMTHYWRTSDSRWFRLADQLSRHVRDIDTYHTNQDRFNFNGGIFWHTNHYVPAGRATHRCYSATVTPPVCGGISIQNCYINGLMTHYYVTGDPETYSSVLETIEYARRLVMGPENFVAKLKYFAKEHIKNFYYDLKSKKSGEVFPYGLFQGPGRESGNALLILVKAYEFTQNKKYLKAAERIARHSIRPTHDHFKMKMDQPEFRWMYLLFLQSLIEFMKIKEHLNERDAIYHHAIKSFDHYLDWMLKNEFSYLDKPDILEYPNETWAMQELRKPHIFYEAAIRTSSSEKRAQFIRRAEELYERAFFHFEKYGERRFLTRPLVLAAAYALIPAFYRKKIEDTHE